MRLTIELTTKEGAALHDYATTQRRTMQHQAAWFVADALQQIAAADTEVETRDNDDDDDVEIGDIRDTVWPRDGVDGVGVRAPRHRAVDV